jgi:polyvinyl alcohol dehydrogenase (cytochrome)
MRRFVPQALRLGLGGLLCLLAVSALRADNQPPRTDWPMFGQNLQNTATTSETTISVKNAGQLKMKWAFTTAGDVSARAAVVGGVAYFPDWTGRLYAVNAGNGKLIWSRSLTDYGLPSGTKSRTTPAVANGRLYIGTQPGAWLLAIDAATGNLLWMEQQERNDPYAIISTSPAVSNGVVYTGVASLAEGGTLVGIPDISAHGPRGSVVAVDAANGTPVWKTYMTPLGYYGAGVWGSNLAVDVGRNTVYASTGNNYLHPDSTAPSAISGKTYGQCITDGGTAATCNAADNYVDAVVALDLGTGAVKWAKSLVTWNQPFVANGSDDWNVDCLWPAIGFPAPGPQCPSSAGPDYDFGSAPNLITYKDGNKTNTILGAGQKSGIYYALDPDTGDLLWKTQVGPGSALGGMEWGSASDGKRIYVQIANLYGIPYAAGRAGSWSALDPNTGQILWQTADPNHAIDIGPMAVANGVVYASSMAPDRDDPNTPSVEPTAPTMFAMDAATGQIIWSFKAGSSVNAGATIANGVVYWGSGYTNLGPPYTGNNKFYAFSTK